MEFKKQILEPRMKMKDAPVDWGPSYWSYSKERQAEREATAAGKGDFTKLIGELNKDWNGFPKGALVLCAGPAEEDWLDLFWISAEPFVYADKSSQDNCPACGASVNYAASTGWKCVSCGNGYGEGVKPNYAGATAIPGRRSPL